MRVREGSVLHGKDMFKLAQELSNNEISRFQWAEEKAARYLTATSILLGASTLIGSRVLANVGRPSDIYGWLLAGVCLVLFASLTIAWSYTHRALSIETLGKLPLNERMIEFLSANDGESVYKGLVEKLREAHAENRQKANARTGYLRIAHRALYSSGFALVLASAMYTIYAGK